MTPRAGILITGTEVLTGIISDRNGPWLSERLRDIGVDAAMIQIVADRPDDLLAALEFMERAGMALIVTSGGLGPTADDLTAEVVGRFAAREMVLDPRLEERIAEILRPMMRRWPGLDPDAIRASNRKQAVIPDGATVLDPVGTAPGLVVPLADREGPTVVVLPGPPRELQPMWETASKTEAFRHAIAGATTYRTGIVRLFGIPESEIANTLRAAEADGLALDELEITTCLRRGEIEVATRYEPAAEEAYDALIAFIAERHSDTLFSVDGATVDEQVAGLLHGRTVAVAESCTGGLMAARLTDRPGSSEYFAGGIVAYSNEAKTEIVGVDRALIERYGAVSTEVAEALASGAAERFGADIGIGVTGIAGPGGGTEEKPVGLVCFSVFSSNGAVITRSTRLPGNRADIRDRSTTVAMHLLRRLLLGESDEPAPRLDGLRARPASRAHLDGLRARPTARPRRQGRAPGPEVRERRARSAVRRARAPRRRPPGTGRMAPARRRERSRAAPGCSRVAARHLVLPRLAVHPRDRRDRGRVRRRPDPAAGTTICRGRDLAATTAPRCACGQARRRRRRARRYPVCILRGARVGGVLYARGAALPAPRDRRAGGPWRAGPGRCAAGPAEDRVRWFDGGAVPVAADGRRVEV